MTTLLETIFTTIDTHIDNKLTNSNGHAAQPLFPHEDGDRRNLTTSDIVEMQKTLQRLDEKLQRHEERIDIHLDMWTILDKTSDSHDTRIGEHEERLDTHSTAIDEHEERLDTHSTAIDKHEERLDHHSEERSELREAIENVFCDFDMTDYCNVTEIVSEHIDADSIANEVAELLDVKITVA